jgi:hypothetical protein
MQRFDIFRDALTAKRATHFIESYLKAWEAMGFGPEAAIPPLLHMIDLHLSASASVGQRGTFETNLIDIQRVAGEALRPYA